MTGYLLDTDVVSAFAPTKSPVTTEIASWFEQQTDRLFLGVISVIEIEAGINKLRRTGARRRADEIDSWFDHMLELYQERVIPLDLATARVAGALRDDTLSAGHDPGVSDIAIAATAKVRDLIVLTRNTRHFRPLGVAVLDPFTDPLPAGP